MKAPKKENDVIKVVLTMVLWGQEGGCLELRTGVRGTR